MGHKCLSHTHTAVFLVEAKIVRAGQESVAALLIVKIGLRYH